MNRILTLLARYLHPRGAVSFWHTNIGAVRYDYSTLDNYYIDLTEKTQYSGPFDASGIPLLNYFGTIGKQYNPCAIAQWGLGAYQRWRAGEAQYETVFLKSADWLVSNLSLDASGRGFWWYQFDFDAYALKKPWPSALAQAQGISVLLRAFLTTNKDHYLLAANRACKAMLSPVEEGGLLLHNDGNTFLEEVVADRPTAILDGLIFAIFGLRDFCLVRTDEISAQSILNDCISTIERLLPLYDLGYWSRADLYSDTPPMPSSNFYHRLHVAQLQVLADITGRKRFNYYSNRWAQMASSPATRLKARLSKIAFKLTHY